MEIQLLEGSNKEKSPSVEYDPSSDTKTEPTSRMAETSKVRVARGELRLPLAKEILMDTG